MDNLDTCRLNVNHSPTNMSGYDFINEVSLFNNKKNAYSHISSKPHKFCFCEKNKINYTRKSISIIVPPGRIFSVSVAGVGVMDKAVPLGHYSLYTSTDDIELIGKNYSYKKNNFSVV